MWPGLCSWHPNPPAAMAETDLLLRKLCKQNLARKFMLSLTDSRKNQLFLKMEASNLFRGNKALYAASVATPFVGHHLDEDLKPKAMQVPGMLEQLWMRTDLFTPCLCSC